MSEPAAPSLLSVPPELHLRIAWHLRGDAAALRRLAGACRALRDAADDNAAWRSAYAALLAPKQRATMPKPCDYHFLIDFGGQPDVLSSAPPGPLAGALRERRRRGLVPAALAREVDSLLADLDSLAPADAVEARADLSRLLLATFPAFLAPAPSPPPFSSPWKLSFHVLLRDLRRTFVTPSELAACDFDVRFRGAGWLGWPDGGGGPSPRRFSARHSPDGTVLFDGHRMAWRFVGDVDAGGSRGWFGAARPGGAHHSRCVRMVQTEMYPPKSVARASDGGWVLFNAQVVYISVDAGPEEAAEGEGEGQETDGGDAVPVQQALLHHGNPALGAGLGYNGPHGGPGIAFAKEVVKVLAFHAAVVFGFGLFVAWMM